jgi:DNA polymerase elongation subunit (family B)
MSKGYENAPFLITKTIDKIMTSKIQLQDLVVYKFLHQDLDKYCSLFPHVAAAIQFSKAGWSSVKCAIYNTSIQTLITRIHFVE